MKDASQCPQCGSPDISVIAFAEIWEIECNTCGYYQEG